MRKKLNKPEMECPLIPKSFIPRQLKEGKKYQWNMGAEPLECTYLRKEETPRLCFVFQLDKSTHKLSVKDVKDWISELEG